MRLFNIILSIYLLALSFVPCKDTCIDGCQQIPESTAQYAFEQQTEQQQQEQDDDHCTPFCTCNCCGQIFNIRSFLPKVTPTFIVSNREKPVAHYQSSTGSNFHLLIWQPPRSC